VVDCRDCKYFIPFEKLDHDTAVQALKIYVLTPKRRSLKGWCAKRQDIVTYYTGICSHFARKPAKGRQLTLDEVRA